MEKKIEKNLFRQQRKKNRQSKNGKKSERKKRNWNDIFFSFFFFSFAFFAFNCVVVHETTHGTRRAPPETKQHTRYERVEAVIETDFMKMFQHNPYIGYGRVSMNIVYVVVKIANGYVVYPSFDKTPTT